MTICLKKIMFTYCTIHIKMSTCQQIFRKSIQKTINIAYKWGIGREKMPLVLIYILLNYLILSRGMTFTIIIMIMMK